MQRESDAGDTTARIRGDRAADGQEEAAAIKTELEEARWSVISFDRCEASGLDHESAANVLIELEKRGIAGLCIVTDEAAARLGT